MKLHNGHVGLIVVLLSFIALTVAGGILFLQKRCGAWPFEDFNIRCELGQRIVSNKVFTKTLTWEECLKISGAVLQESYPAKCVTPDGRSVDQASSDEERNKLPLQEQGGPYISLSPTTVTIGGKTSVFGQGFCTSKDCSKVVIKLADKIAISDVSVDLNGKFIEAIPTSNSLGRFIVTASQTDASGKTIEASAPLTIAVSDFKKQTSGKTSGACSKDRDCATGYKCLVPNCDAVKDQPGGDDCYITAPSCTKSP